MEADDQRIRVAIRVRCLSNKEKDKKKLAQWTIMENKLWQIDPKSENKIGQVYTFDHVFGMESFTKDIFEELVKPIVESCVQGFNGTIFAYGQTSSGKTYTMMGDKAEDGVIPLSVNHIFKTVENIPSRDFLIRVSYMEIYNEHIKDLLEIKNCNLKIHEDLSGQAYVTLKEEITDTPEKVLSIMKKGEKNRTFGSTDINERSSRSHTIFRIIIESRKQQGSEASENFDWDDAMQVSILNLVDLAGSERVVQTKATGDRFKEGCAINKSLFYLGNVIAQLSEGSGQYVNFRDSKLTRILRTSLGGNAHTAIICAVTPASVEETISTLSFASRAMCVKNEPHVNEIMTDECLMRRHAAMVTKLEQDLEKARQDNECSNIKKELEEKEKIIRQLKDWIQRDQIRFSSPQLVYKTDRRKTWAAPELLESLKRNQQISDKLESLPEETADIDFSMESLMEEYEDETELSNISNRRRRSSGNWKRVSRLPIRNSLQNTASCSSNQIRRFSYDENAKKRKKGPQVFERLTTEEIDSSKKVLYEAITRLKGSRPVNDFNTCTLVELITEVGSLAETLEPMVNKSNSPLEGSKKLSSLESLLEKTKLELDKISSEKNELQSFLKLEQEKCFDIDNRLKEALEKLEEYSTVVEKNDELSKDVASMLEKSRIGEEELVSRLNEETDKVVKLRNELHAKILDLENQNAIVKECKVQLDEEKIKSELMEVKLKEALSKLGSCGTHVPAQLMKWAEEIIALKGQLEYCLHNLSNIKPAYNESEHFSSFDVDVHLQLSLDIVQTVLMQLNELSEKLKSTDFNAESLPENETFKCTLEDSTHEMIPVECIKVEQKDMLNNTCESNKDVSMNCGLVDQGLDESVLLNYKEKVYGLEIELQKSNERLYNIMSEKRSIEDLLVIEREQLKNAEGRLQDASHQIETLICNVNEAAEKSKSNEEILASKIAQQMERIIYLEDELEANEFVVANLAISEEEAILDLKEQTGKVKLLEEKLKEAEEKLMHVFEENDRIKTEMSIKENEMSAILSEQVKNMSKLEGTVEEYKSKLDEMNALEGSYKTDVSSVITEYKEKILKLEEDAQRYSCELMKLGLEKGEREAELVSEKERYGMVCMLLNETIAKMVNVYEELKISFKIKEIEEPKTKEVSLEEIENIGSMNDTSEELIAMENKEIYVEENCNSDQLQKNMKKVKELVQIFERYVAEISKVHLEKEELESMLQIAKEGHENITKQLDQALNNAENLTKELNEASYKHKEIENRLESLMENESKKVKILEEDLEKKQTDLDKLSSKAEELDNLMSEELFANQVNGSEIASKMLDYEQKIAELEKVLLKNASDILVLESEKAELESIVIAVYANYDHASTELTEALGNVDILTKEYEESSVRHKEAEGMLESLLRIEKEKVGELQGKVIELEKLSSKLEQLDMLLNEERSKKEDVQTDVAGKISDYEEIIAKLTNELNESSTTHKEAEDMLQCLLNDEIEKVKNLKEDLENKESVIEKFTSKIEELDTILNEERSKKDLMYLELTSKLTECEQKMAELQTEVSKYASDVSLLGLEKGELESLLVSEKENTQKLSAQLQEVLSNLDNVKDLNQQTENYREAEGMFESLLNREQEKVRKLEADLESKEADLESKEADLENFSCRIEELDSLLIEERSKKEDVQSNVAGKLSDYEEIVAKLSNDLKESSTKHKEAEDVLQCLLNDEIEKVKNLKEDLENKESVIEKFALKIEELDTILSEERSKKELMYLELTSKLTECEQKMAELQTEVSKYASDVSLLGLEKGEMESLLVSEKENSQKLSVQLQEVLSNLDNIVKDLNKQTEKYREAEGMFESLLNNEKENVRKLEADLESKEADLENFSCRIEELDIMLIEEKSKNDIFKSEIGDKISKYEQKIDELEMAVTKNTSDYVALGKEKGELESLLTSEKQIVKNLTDQLNESSVKHRIAEENLLLRLSAEVEKVNNYQAELQSKTLECTELSIKIEDYILQLQEQVTISEKLKIVDDKMQVAVHEIDNLICSQKKATEKSKSKEEDLASKLAKQIERIIHLEDELEATEFVVANLAISEEEAILDLKEQTGKVSWLEEKMKEAEEKLMCACEEKDRIKAEMSTRILQEEAEGMLESLLSDEKEKVKKLEADLAIKEVDLETKDADLENLSCRLEELDRLLNEEKSKNEMFNSEIADKISKYEQKIDELEVVVSKNMSDNLTLRMEKGELESLLSFEKENCHKISNQLHEALSSLENLTKELSESAERHKEETDSLKSLLNEKIEMVEKLESELLTKESNLQTFCSEIEQLKMSLNEEISEKEMIKSDLANKTSEYEKIVKNLTEELNESSEKQRKTEENLILQLNTELEKVSNYQEELQSKTQECQELNLKVEDYILQLQDQVAISDKKDVEIQQLLSKCNSFEEKVESFETCGLNTAEKVSEQVVRILELEVLVEECQQELNSFRSKNLDLESVLAAEKEKSEAVNSQLKDSLEKIDSLKMETEEAFEKCKVMEQELQLKSLEVEQMNGKTGEFDSLLKQEKGRCNEINKEMQKVLEEFSVLKEEKEKLAVEFGEREKTALFAHEEEMKTQNVLVEKTKSELSSITLERDDLRNSLNSVQAKYDSTKGRLQNALQDIDTISNKLIEVANECESLKANKSEALSIKNELENAKYALSVCAKSEEDLDNLLTIEKGKVAELQKQLDEEKNKEKVAEDKNLEMSNSLLTLEAELKSLKDEHNNCVESESRWMKSNEVQFNELKELNVKLAGSKLKIEKLEVMLESKVNDVAEAHKENDRVTLLLELGNKKISDLEDNIKVLNEKLHVKSQAFVDETAKVAQLQYDLKDAENKLQAASEVNENKITMMESMLKAENKKCVLKMEEVESLRVHTKELVELLKAERGRVSILEEEVKSLKTEIDSQLTDGNKLKVLEIELHSSIELEKKERVHVEKELEKVKSDLASSHLCQNELKSEIQCLATKLQQETTKCVELRTLLDIEKEAHSSAREAEKRIVSVLSAQEKAISLIESVKGVAGTDTKALNDIIQEKENKIIELSEKLKEAEKFGKDMEEMAMKFERRRNIVLDHRMEIQNKAKETEDRLLKEIAELKSANSGAEKCKCSEMEKELVAERFKIEGLQSKLQSALGEVKDGRSQVEEYKKELQRCKLLLAVVSRKDTNLIECAVQTDPITQSEVLDIRPEGSSVVQYYKIDLLEQKVKKLEEDKEMLKKLCRRRHDQRVELKIQVEELTNKIQGKEKGKENKENMNMNQ